jgi:hypothetical protein
MKESSRKSKIRRVVATILWTIGTGVTIRGVPTAAIIHPKHHPKRSPIHRPGQYSPSNAPSVLHSTYSNATHVDDTMTHNGSVSSSNEYDLMTFRSQFATESQTLPVCDLPLKEFFENPRHLSFGKSLPSKIIPHTPELLEQWTAACRRVGATLPRTDNGNSLEVILSVRTAGLSFPGLKLEWSALIGVRLAEKCEADDLPELEFVLIRDETSANGVKPLVWAYNKLNKGAKNESASSRKTNFLTRFGFYRSEGDAIVLRCKGNMEMSFRVPAVTRRLVGSDTAGKAKTEKRVSDLITQQIEKDVVKSVSHWEENFRSWVGDKENYISTTNLG